MAEETNNTKETIELSAISKLIGQLLNVLGSSIVPLLSQAPTRVETAITKATGMPMLGSRAGGLAKQALSAAVDTYTETSGLDFRASHVLFGSNTALEYRRTMLSTRISRELEVAKLADAEAQEHARRLAENELISLYGKDSAEFQAARGTEKFKTRVSTLKAAITQAGISDIVSGVIEDAALRRGSIFGVSMTPTADQAVIDRQKRVAQNLTGFLTEALVGKNYITGSLSGADLGAVVSEFGASGGFSRGDEKSQREELKQYIQRIAAATDNIKGALGRNLTFEQTRAIAASVYGFDIYRDPVAAESATKAIRMVVENTGIKDIKELQPYAQAVNAVASQYGIRRVTQGMLTQSAALLGMSAGQSRDFGFWGMSDEEQQSMVAERIVNMNLSGDAEIAGLALRAWMTERGMDTAKAATVEDLKTFHEDMRRRGVDIRNAQSVARGFANSEASYIMSLQGSSSQRRFMTANAALLTGIALRDDQALRDEYAAGLKSEFGADFGKLEKALGGSIYNVSAADAMDMVTRLIASKDIDKDRGAALIDALKHNEGRFAFLNAGWKTQSAIQDAAEQPKTTAGGSLGAAQAANAGQQSNLGDFAARAGILVDAGQKLQDGSSTLQSGSATLKSGSETLQAAAKDIKKLIDEWAPLVKTFLQQYYGITLTDGKQ